MSGVPGRPPARPGPSRNAPDGPARDQPSQHGSGQHGSGQHRSGQHGSGQHGSGQHGSASTGQPSTRQDSTGQASTRQASTRQASTPRPARGASQASTGQAGANQPGAELPPDPAAETALFTRWAHDYAADRFRQQIAVLLAGAVTAASDLGLAGLRDAGADISVGLVDDDQPVTRAAITSQPALARCTLGDLRTVALPQRSFDIVACTLLLDRIEHAELVLDRLTGALKPGGLLLLQVRDRDCAAAFLDRMLPDRLRGAIWRQHRPGRPGPHPAVYERLGTVRGIQSYALLRGLVIAERQPLGGLAGGLPRAPRGYLAAQKMIARFSGRAHRWPRGTPVRAAQAGKPVRPAALTQPGCAAPAQARHLAHARRPV